MGMRERDYMREHTPKGGVLMGAARKAPVRSVARGSFVSRHGGDLGDCCLPSLLWVPVARIEAQRTTPPATNGAGVSFRPNKSASCASCNGSAACGVGNTQRANAQREYLLSTSTSARRGRAA